MEAAATDAITAPDDASAAGAVTPPAGIPAAEAPPAVPAPGDVTPLPGERVFVLIFGSDSWVDVRDAGGARLYYGLGAAGSRRTLRGVPPFEIFLGRYLDVTIEVDGQPQAIPAESVRGNTARFTLAPT